MAQRLTTIVPDLVSGLFLLMETSSYSMAILSGCAARTRFQTCYAPMMRHWRIVLWKWHAMEMSASPGRTSYHLLLRGWMLRMKWVWEYLLKVPGLG